MPHEEIVVSVIVPFYNASQYIGHCVRSLFSQTMKSGIQYVFIDDGSTDGSLSELKDILNKFPDRSQQVIIESVSSNCGISASRHRGVALATGEYVIHCDADDYVAPDMYEQLYRAAKMADADIAVCDFYKVTGRECVRCSGAENSDKLKLVHGLLSGRVHGALWNKLVRRRLYGDIGEAFVAGTDIMEDTNVTARLAARARTIVCIPLPYYFYTQDSSSSATRHWTRSKIEGMIRNMNSLADFFEHEYAGTDLSALKYRTRLLALYYCSRDSREVYRMLYPEVSHGFRINTPVLMLPQRLVACSLDCSLDILADMLISVRNIINRFRK